MLDLLIYSVVFFVFACAAAGFGKLFMVSIHPDEIFGAWQKVLNQIRENAKTKKPKFYYEFWYKSLGGCDTCTRQRIAELTYIALAILIKANGWWITEPVFYWISELSEPFAWVVIVLGNFFLFCLFSGLVMYVGQALHYEKRQAEMAEEIIEQTPKRKQ